MRKSRGVESESAIAHSSSSPAVVGGFDHLVEDVAELRHRRLGIRLSSNDLFSEDYDLFDGVLGREWRGGQFEKTFSGSPLG